jgi:hypothetical protein
MRNSAELLSFGGGHGGALVDFVIASPLCAGINSGEEFWEYYCRLDEALESCDYDCFIKSYRLGVQYLSPWFEVEPGDLETVKIHRQTLLEIGRVFRDNYDVFFKQVWPTEKCKMEPIAKILEERFAGTDVIGQWEALTHITFKRSAFSAVLSSAIANGPNANSFDYDKVVFYHETPLPKLLDLIIHEVGTHILIEPFRSVLSSGQFDRGDIYKAYECLARCFTAKIVNRSPNYDLSDYGEDFFNPIIERTFVESPNISMEDLLRQLLHPAGR